MAGCVRSSANDNGREETRPQAKKEGQWSIMVEEGTVQFNAAGRRTWVQNRGAIESRPFVVTAKERESHRGRESVAQ